MKYEDIKTVAWGVGISTLCIGGAAWSEGYHSALMAVYTLATAFFIFFALAHFDEKEKKKRQDMIDSAKERISKRNDRAKHGHLVE